MDIKTAKKIGNTYIAEDDIVDITLAYVPHDTWRILRVPSNRVVTGRVSALRNANLTLDVSTQYNSNTVDIAYDDMRSITLHAIEEK